MKDIFKNIWIKRAVSVFCLIYTAVVVILTVATFLYRMEVNEGAQAAFFTVYFIISALFLVFMLYSKEIILTRINGMLLTPIVFFLVLFNMGNIIIFVPPLIVAIVMFFCSRVPEKLKVLLGTIYLMMYIIGIFAYFVLNTLLSSSAVETRLDANLSPDSDVYSLYDMNYVLSITNEGNTISPDGKMQFYICDVENKEDGQVIIYVEPYGEDKYFNFFTLRQKGIRRKVKFFSGRGEIPEVFWSDNNVLTYRMPDSTEYRNSLIILPEKNYFEFIGVY